MIINSMIYGAGGSASLKVKAYSAFPASAEENEIGIITTTPITGYYVGSTAPAVSEGLVWIRPNRTSPTPIPLTRKNDFFFYPLGAEQVQGGVWVQVRVMCYQNGVWTGWLNYAFKSSDVSLAEANILDFRSGNTNVATIQKEFMKISASASQNPRICSYKNVNVSDYRYLNIDITRLSGTAALYFGLNESFDNASNNVPDIVSKAIESGSGVTTLDISDVNTTSYIKINGTASGAREYRVNNVWLEG